MDYNQDTILLTGYEARRFPADGLRPRGKPAFYFLRRGAYAQGNEAIPQGHRSGVSGDVYVLFDAVHSGADQHWAVSAGRF